MAEAQHNETSLIRVYYSYATADEWLVERLEMHLSGLERQGLMQGWHRGKIGAGEDALQLVEHNFKKAKVILLLLSADSLAADDSYNEILWAMERHENGSAYVIPVLLRPVDITGYDFARLLCVPRNQIPVTQWSDHDRAFEDAARSIRAIIEYLHSSSGFEELSAPLRIRPKLFMAADIVSTQLVARPDEYEQVKQSLLKKQRKVPVAITTALQGAGGYGKTTLAQVLCHDLDIWTAFPDGVLWVTLGEKPDNLLGTVTDLIYILTKETPNFGSLEIASKYLKMLLADKKVLIVIDDVWDKKHLQPFLEGGEGAACLITTRNRRLLPADAYSVTVDAMRSEEAKQLLITGLTHIPQTSTDAHTLSQLAARLKEWPLLLGLVNGVLRERVGKAREALADALSFVNTTLDEEGWTAFDEQDTQERSEAIEKTLQVSFRLLSPNDYARYTELAIFPEDIDIPLATLQKLWSATGNLENIKVEKLCQHFSTLSLLRDFDLNARTIRLHDVIRTYLRETINDKLLNLNAQFLGSYRLTRWADLPQEEAYLWNYLAYHFIEAGHGQELVATVKDLHYLAKKTLLKGTYTVETDLEQADRLASTDVSLNLLKRNYIQMSHILNRCVTYIEIAEVFLSRLSHLNEFSDACRIFVAGISNPFFTLWDEFPKLPQPYLIRALQGHTRAVTSCAMSPLGDLITSASEDGTLKIWDAHTGKERFTLYGHMDWVNDCAFSSDGTWIVSASADRTLKKWSVITGRESFTLYGHTGSVSACKVSPNGDWIVSASYDGTLMRWDAYSGMELSTLRGHTGAVLGCTVSPGGDWIVSTSADRTLKVWDAHTGKERFTLHGHRDWVNDCAVSPDGIWLVSSSNDCTLRIWDAIVEELQLSLQGHNDSVNGCAISPDGAWLASASSDKTLKVWDARTGKERFSLQGHTRAVNDCAISPNGNWIVSASSDDTLKVWGAYTGKERFSLQGHTRPVHSCAVSPNEDWIVSASSDKTLKVWDARTGKERFSLQGHSDFVNDCAISPGGDWLASASSDGTLKLWDARSGRCLTTLVADGPLHSCAFFPDGEHVEATGTKGVYILQWVK